jgi:hypothetical protein
MPLVHIVLFEFKPIVERGVIQDVRQSLSMLECGAIAGSRNSDFCADSLDLGLN